MLQDQPLTVKDLRGMRERLAEALDAVHYPQGTNREWFFSCLSSISQLVQDLPENAALPYLVTEQLDRLIAFLRSHDVTLTLK